MTTHALEVAVRERDAIVVIDLIGDVNGSADAALDAAYTQATRGGARVVGLNFARADYINSSGIALIVRLLAQARSSGVHVSAFGLTDHYREIFEITRLADFMTITDDEDHALDAVAGGHDD